MKADLLATVVAKPPIPPITSREELIDALGKAAEIEHALMCMYLYAAFSLDRTAPGLSPADQEHVRAFAATTLLIARQEMEHLGIVSNLLIGVGATPNFDRPNLPLQANYYQVELPLQLLPFGEKFLVLAEQLEEPCQDHPHEPLPYFPSVAAIYDRIRDGVARLGEAPGFFLGAGDPQLSNASFGVPPAQLWYDVALLPVTDRATALAAVDLIRIQGEGATFSDPHSHYSRFKAMHAIWDALPEATRALMVRPAPANPLTVERGDVNPRVTCTVLTDPRAVALARLENRCYELILLLLSRLYGATDASDADRAMYQEQVFFPLMTMVIRPVSEILVELPAGDGRHSAVPTFELDGPIRTYLDRTTFNVQLAERLTHLAAGFAEVAALPDVPARMQYVAKNVAYTRDRILAYNAGTNTSATS